MAKKKTIEPIIGTSKDPENRLTVQKSIPLFSLWQSNMSLSEFKILDTYLSRINSHDPEKRTVVFTKGELEKLLGVKKINKSQLAARLKSLGRFIDVEDGNTKKVHQIALFEEAYGEMDSNGLWTVKLTCTTKAMKYIFNIDKLGYLRYKLHSIVCLKSRYAYVLFLYLEYNRFRKSWEIDVDMLRQFLNCDQDKSYAAFKVFNDRILKRCQKEIHEKTECRFEYEPIKMGRRVTAIRFTLETLADSIEPPIPGQMTIADYEDLVLDPDDPLIFLSSACNNEFSREQMEVLLAAIAAKDLPPHPDGLEFARYHYLQQQYAMLNVRAAAGKITHRFEYLLKMIQNN